MTVLRISKDEIREYERLKVISQIAAIRSRIESFEKKYHRTLGEFEAGMPTRRKEDFGAWDDCIEWKAYVRALHDLEVRLKEIDNAQDIRVT